MKKIPDLLSSSLWIVLLIIIGVASMSSVRWVSPSIHMDSYFGPTKDLSHALILGLGVLLAALFGLSYRSTNVTQSCNFLLKSSIIVLISGLMISSFFASDKTLAFYTAGGLGIGLILMAVTWRLADEPWKIQLAMILIVSLGVTFAARVWIREVSEFDEGWKHYLETRQEFWAKQGKPLDDPTVKMFEARMKSRDNGGFFFHGNLGGMWLTTVWLVSLGLVGKRWRERHAKYGWAWLVTAGLMSGFIASGLVMTQSKGAILSAIMGVMIIGLVWRFRKAFKQHFKTAVAGAVILVGLAGGAMVGYGLVKKTLPTLSMAYRWQYWVASWGIFKDHWLTGVGSGNYGHYYQRYKLPEAEEEVTSPHNFVVQGFTQFGIIGGIGFVLLPAGILYGVAKRSKEKTWMEAGYEDSLGETKKTWPRDAMPCHPAGPSATIMLLTLWVGIFGVLFLFNQSGQPSVIGLVAEYLWYLLIFPGAFVLASIRGDQFDRIDHSPVGAWEVLCLAAAGAALILGDVVNFSMEEPQTQFLFFFIAGLAMAGSEREERDEHRTSNIEHSTLNEEKAKVVEVKSSQESAKGKKQSAKERREGKAAVVSYQSSVQKKDEQMDSRPRGNDRNGDRGQSQVGRMNWKPAAGIAMVIILYVYFLMRPAMLGEEAATAKYGAERTFAELASQYPYDGHLAAMAGDSLIETAKGNPQPTEFVKEAAAWYRTAAERVKVESQFDSKIGQTELMLAELEPEKRADHFRQAEEAIEEAREKSPRSKTLAMTLGMVYASDFLQSPGKKELAEKAVRNLEEAKRLDAALPAESIRHFSERQKEEIEKTMQNVKCKVQKAK